MADEPQGEFFHRKIIELMSPENQSGHKRLMKRKSQKTGLFHLMWL